MPHSSFAGGKGEVPGSLSLGVGVSSSSALKLMMVSSLAHRALLHVVVFLPHLRETKANTKWCFLKPLFITVVAWSHPSMAMLSLLWGITNSQLLALGSHYLERWSCSACLKPVFLSSAVCSLFQLHHPDVFCPRYMTKLLELLPEAVVALSRRLLCSKSFTVANLILSSGIQYGLQMAQKKFV